MVLSIGSHGSNVLGVAPVGAIDQHMNIYGECIGTLACTPVMISALAGEECELQPRTHTGSIDGLLDLWIGAIGPLLVTAENSGGGRYRARFAEPLDARIIAHFAQAA